MQDGSEKFYSIGYAANKLGFTQQTIRKMVDTKEITGFKTQSGQRRISNRSIQHLLDQARGDEELRDCKRNYIYTRVSTKKQLGDFLRQIEFCKRQEYSQYILIKDIGSGINFKRKGLQTILDSCIQGNVGEVVVAHKDRLSRFAFDLIETIVSKAGGKITVLEKNKENTTEQELAEDLLSIVHIYSCRQMGKRSYSRKGEPQENFENIKDKVLPK